MKRIGTWKLEGGEAIIADLKQMGPRAAKALRKASVQLGKAARKAIHLSTRTWSSSSQPDIKVRTRSKRRPGGIEFSQTIETNSYPFLFVDQGTRAHRITPKAAGYPLAWQSGYKAKTRPGSLGSLPGGSTGKPMFAYSVMHPGTEARHILEKAGDFAMKNVGDKVLRDAMEEILIWWR